MSCLDINDSDNSFKYICRWDTWMKRFKRLRAKFPYNFIPHYACGVDVCSPLSRHQKTTKKAYSSTVVVLFLPLFSVNKDRGLSNTVN